MTKLIPLSYNDLIKKIKKAGFVFDRQAKGSHEIWYNPINKLRTTIPNHPGDLKIGTIRGILHQIGLSPEEFNRL